MKLLSVVLFSTLAAVGLAQGILIGYPPANKYIHPSQNLTVQVVQPESIEGPIVVGIAIGIAPCTKTSPCLPPNETVGEIFLHAGPYKPTGHAQGGFYQNFTVWIPDYIPKGKAQLNVALAGLIGADNFLLWEATSKKLNVV